MARKFWTSYDALVANYNANDKIPRFLLIADSWVETTRVDALPAGYNLIAMAIGAATVTLASSGSPCDVSISLDGIHALVACDDSSHINALKFDVATNLWVTNGSISSPLSNNTNIAITPDGLRGIVVPKSGSVAYPLSRNPATDLWSIGSAISLGQDTTRYFSASMSPDGNVCLIGSDFGTASDALVWNGTAWIRSAVSHKFGAAKWLSDGKTILAAGGNSGDSVVLVLAYDAVTQTFSLQQTLTIAQGILLDVAVPELGRQDVALVAGYTNSNLIPLANVGGTWSAGTPIASSNFHQPMGVVIMPMIA